MRKLACLVAAVSAAGAIAAATPASAAVGQCYDATGRPFGPPHNTDNPPYRMICQAYLRGGWCTHVQPGWARNTCPQILPGYYSAPRYQYRERQYYRDRRDWRDRRDYRDWRRYDDD
jgi:hypothetical protein